MHNAPVRIGRATTTVLAVLTLVLTGALASCGGSSSESCLQAEEQVADCLDRFCANDEGRFCACYADGQHLVTSGGCTCEDGTVWEQMQESVCEELDGEPQLDCKGLRATIQRYEGFGGCG